MQEHWNLIHTWWFITFWKKLIGNSYLIFIIKITYILPKQLERKNQQYNNNFYFIHILWKPVSELWRDNKLHTVHPPAQRHEGNTVKEGQGN